jgi:hypothetical protein
MNRAQRSWANPSFISEGPSERRMKTLQLGPSSSFTISMSVFVSSDTSAAQKKRPHGGSDQDVQDVWRMVVRPFSASERNHFMPLPHLGATR